jgi:hypothetical protein
MASSPGIGMVGLPQERVRFSPADRPCVARVAAKPRDRNRRVGGIAAADGEVRARLDLAVGRREILYAKQLIQHHDAGAQNAAPLKRRNRPPPRRG